MIPNNDDDYFLDITSLKDIVPQRLIEICIYVVFTESIIERVVGFAMAILLLADYFQNLRKSSGSESCKTPFAVKGFLSLSWHFSHPILIGFLLYGDLDDGTARTISSISMFLSALLNIVTLSQLPTFGIKIHMIKRVGVSVFKFFLTFGIIFLSFCFIFHILMPESESFGKLNVSIMKVLVMFMGELDFTNSFVKGGEPGITAKIFFMIFMVVMALVFMNLLLGIAVSDIHELERISQSQSALINSFSIRGMESFIMMVR